MLVVRISKPEIGKYDGYILGREELGKNVLGEIDAMLDYGEVGDSLLITVEEIPKEKYENLPEFTGW